MKMKHLIQTMAVTLAVAMVLPVTASAHGVWLETRLDKLTIVLGEGVKDNVYDPKMITSLKAYDEKYKEVSIKQTSFEDHVTVQPDEKAALVAIAFDYGYWSQDPKTSEYKNVPMTELKGSTKGTYALKYNVSYLAPVKEIKEVPNIPYQIVPMTDPSTLKVGDSLTVKVVHNGKAMANTDVILDVTNNPEVMKKTDSKGLITIPIKNETTNVIGIELTLPYTSKDKKASQTKVFSSLSFVVSAQETE